MEFKKISNYPYEDALHIDMEDLIFDVLVNVDSKWVSEWVSERGNEWMSEQMSEWASEW